MCLFILSCCRLFIPGVLALLISFVMWFFGFSHLLRLEPFPLHLQNPNGGVVDLNRGENGLMVIKAENLLDGVFGLGYSHAFDRSWQMCFLRIVVQGRISELLESTPQTNEIDLAVRHLGFFDQSKQAVNQLEHETHAMLSSYVQGINHFFSTGELTWEFKLTGYRPEYEPWTVEDSLALIRLMMWSGLAETQMQLEKFIVEAMAKESTWIVLKKAFSPHLDDFNRSSYSDLISKLNIEHSIIPKSLPHLAGSFRSSNNWVVSGNKSSSGFPVYCSDPHLSILQIPAIFYETQLSLPNNHYIFGITVPGIPGFLMGRSPNLAWGMTYGFMDQVDYFFEYCNDTMCQSDNDWLPITKTKQQILRTGETPLDLWIYKTPNGVLEMKNPPLSDGFHLSRATSHDFTRALPTVHALHRLISASSVPEAQTILRNVDLSGNWILADRQNIGYQQSGALPKRIHSGLFPLDGFKSENKWKGFIDGNELESILNPPEGFISSANDLWQAQNKPISVNAHMGWYRRNRINELLNISKPLTIDHMKAIQSDLVSNQYKRFSKILLPRLGMEPAVSLLKPFMWKSMDYSPSKQSPYVFEGFYDHLMKRTVGALFANVTFVQSINNPKLNQIWPSIRDRIMQTYFHHFDQLLLSDDPALLQLFYGTTPINKAWERIFNDRHGSIAVSSVPEWGTVQSRYHWNLLLGSKFASITNALGMNRGPFSVPGNRATISQGQIWNDPDGRQNSFAPAWRFITDLGSHQSLTILPGGPSGSFLSPYFDSDLLLYYNFSYKTILHIF